MAAKYPDQDLWVPPGPNAICQQCRGGRGIFEDTKELPCSCVICLPCLLSLKDQRICPVCTKIPPKMPVPPIGPPVPLTFPSAQLNGINYHPPSPNVNANYTLFKNNNFSNSVNSFSRDAWTIDSSFLNLVVGIPSHNPDDEFSKEGAQCRMCNSCDEGSRATSRCHDCKEYLCANCVHAHERVTLTKDHVILPFEPAVGGNKPHQMQSPNAATSSNQPQLPQLPQLPHGFCESHETENICLYCDTCRSAICGECTMDVKHVTHKLSSLTDEMIRAKDLTDKLLTDGRQGMEMIEAGMRATKIVGQNVENKVQAISAEIHHHFRRLIRALEERERELLMHVDTIRNTKGQTLQHQVDQLCRGLGQLTASIEDTEHRVAHCPDTAETLKIRDDLLENMQSLRYLMGYLKPHEDDDIMFTPPDLSCYAAAFQLGSVRSSAFAPRCLAKGPRLVTAVRDKHSCFSIQIKDHKGDACNSGSDDLAVQIESPEGTQYRGDILARQKEGIYSVVYRPLTVGHHLVSVTIRGKHIHQSPFTVRVNDRRDYARDIGAYQFGSAGDKDGQLCRPWGVCTDKNGFIIVADRSNNRIQVFTPAGDFHHLFGVSGKGTGQFSRPAGVACDQQGRIIVSDKDNHRIQIFAFNGTFLHKFGDEGSEPGKFRYPWDVDVNSYGYIVVADTRNHRIQLLNGQGHFVRMFGFSSALRWKDFDSPRGVCFNADGEVIVTDFNNHKFIIVTPDFANARQIGREGSVAGKFLRPQGVAVDGEGNIIVADSKNNRIQVIDPKGKFIAAFGSHGSSIGQMDRPCGICVAPDGSIIVVDERNNRVLMF